MKYLKLFDAHSNYETFVGDTLNPMIKPNVSHCVQENDVHYNPLKHDYSKDYLTIESLEDNNRICWTATSPDIRKTISASTDNGQTWTSFTASYDAGTPEYVPTTIATLNAGEKVLVKGENASYGESDIVLNNLYGLKRFNVSGNIMSLIYGDSFENNNVLTEDGSFLGLFRICDVVSAENLILPATTLANWCYYSMFRGCTSLVTAPELPATTLAWSCYDTMFAGCTSLTTAPELPATTLASNCYTAMFAGCTSLTTVAQVPSSVVPISSDCCSYMYCDCPIIEISNNYPISAYNCAQSTPVID